MSTSKIDTLRGMLNSVDKRDKPPSQAGQDEPVMEKALDKVELECAVHYTYAKKHDLRTYSISLLEAAEEV